MQKPSIGRIIVVKGIKSNGQDEHPAIVNCVHGPANDSGGYLSNVTVFPDCQPPQAATSIYVFDNRQAAMDFQAMSLYAPTVGFFPDCV